MILTVHSAATRRAEVVSVLPFVSHKPLLGGAVTSLTGYLWGGGGGSWRGPGLRFWISEGRDEGWTCGRVMASPGT